MNAIKTYFKDYVETQKVCNEFNKKHWKGTMVISLMIGVGTYLALGGYEYLKEGVSNKIDKIKSKKKTVSVKKEEV